MIWPAFAHARRKTQLHMIGCPCFFLGNFLNYRIFVFSEILPEKAQISEVRILRFFQDFPWKKWPLRGRVTIVD
jgi:hypothetical protein